MHKDISGVLTVSTCLLNRDRNCVSDFTQAGPPLPSPQSHMCPFLLSSSPRVGDSTTDTPQQKKKKKKKRELHIFRDVSELKVKVAVRAGTSACLFFFCALNIGYPQFEINNTYFVVCFFFS